MVAATLPGPQMQTGRVVYRPEIDGLRAIAIAPVVLHHADPGMLPGGFTGVDVFFVISGYLITAIIAGELAEGRFGLWRFYERRVRRIVPALAAMLAATTITGWAILTPEDFHQFSKALIAASVFAANLRFARGTDYFESAEGLQPLIHTWTLGVEEQFYLMFPLLLMGASRWRKDAMLVLATLLGLASFALALWLAPRWPVAAFYLLPTRMWELMLGAACALLPKAPRKNGWLATTGLCLILAGLWLIGPETPAPGPLFLLPTLGTALIILFAQSGTGVARLLGWRLLVLLGMISFGTYLWHQPVLFFLHYVWFGPLPMIVTVAGIFAALALGTASWRWLEEPVRRRRALARPARLVLACSAALIVPLAAGGAGYLTVLLPRSGAEAQRLAGLRPPNASAQVIVPDHRPLSFVVYGDSHAAQYFDAATARFGTGALLSNPGCLSAGAVSNRLSGDPEGAACRGLAARLTELVAERQVRTVIWAQRWERMLYADGSDAPLGTTFGKGGTHLVQAMAGLADTLPPQARGIIVGNSPTAWAAGPLLEHGWLRCRAWRNVDCPDSYPAARAEGREVSAMLRAFAARDPRFTYVDAQAPLCPDGRCLLRQHGQLNYWDGSHMTTPAAARVMATIGSELLRP
jgi:peptidoglycan/LPS O-acetylase OafA/YrhL